VGRKRRAIILDTHTILSYLDGESTAELVANIISDAVEENIPLCISAVNAAEVWSILAQRVSESDATRSLAEIQQLGIKVIEADWNLALEAAVLKSRYKISLSSCFTAALTIQKRGVLITGDEEFRRVDKGLTIEWI
jgi:predicted nucleic acid-binding protein